MQGRKRSWKWALALGLIAGAVGCGPIFEDDSGGGGTGGGGQGPLCFTDSDCVPNACCGQGTGVVSSSNAPDCSDVQCNNGCPSNQLMCGCGLPVCRDGHCSVATTVGPGCP